MQYCCHAYIDAVIYYLQSTSYPKRESVDPLYTFIKKTPRATRATRGATAGPPGGPPQGHRGATAEPPQGLHRGRSGGPIRPQARPP